MSEKPITKRRTDSDHVDDKKPAIKVEVVEDLDLPQEDAEAVRGGRCTILAANFIQTMTNP